MEFFLDAEQRELRGHVRAWVEANLRMRCDEETDDQARRLVQLLGEARFLAHAVPRDFGGVREKVQARDLCLLREELARGFALADSMLAMQALGSHPIILAGTKAQRARYLPPIASGEAIAAFALTEPEAGSDVASMEARAIRRDRRYCLSGTKRFISNAGLAHTYVVFASTNPEQGAKGISAFIVEASTPGLVVKERTRLLAPHPIGVIAFEDCLVADTQLLGAEGDGLRIALRSLDTLRCTVGAAALGIAQRALEEAVHYSRNRRQFKQAIGEFQSVQFKLAEMATELTAARLLVYQAAWTNDRGGEGLSAKSAMAKLFATEAAQRIVDQALQIHGAVGLIAGTVMEQLYRDVRALRIYEGTSEIQKLVIARSLLRDRSQTGSRHGD